MNQFVRTEMMLGPEAMARLGNARVAVFGVGGVGGHAAEALVRSGVGALDLIDKDTVSLSNLNRQIFALRSTLGRPKVEAAADRLLDINPDLRLTLHNMFYGPDTAGELDFSRYDYVVDAVDTVTAKLSLVLTARERQVPIISAMGTGNKLDPMAFRVADIYATSVCPLARIMRKECRKRGIPRLKVVYSTEEPIIPAPPPPEELSDPARRATPSSNAFVPAAAGLLLASEVIKDLIST